MKASHVVLALITVFSLGCNEQTKQNEFDVKSDKDKFVGLWHLYIMEQQDSVTGKWNDWRNGMQGYILYDNTDHMAVHLTTKGYENTELRFPNFTDTISMEALKYLTKSYTYFAKYKVNDVEKVVEHARISHSNPGEWNAIVKRRYTLSGDTLILEPLERVNSSLRLKWVKSKLD